ncbi:head-tail connector protein [Brevundimonas sp.]|uniref:head-tail connector protein n=1 Tax=Brevundimonas sp. TaxID=1871086 RepID=UPI002ED831FB
MWRPPVVTAAPTDQAITLAAAKKHLRVDHDDDDALIEGMVAAAVGHVESVTGQRLVRQTLTIRCGGWNDLAALSVAPVVEILAIRYRDGSGVDQTLSAAEYEARLEGLLPEIVRAGGASWPSVQAGSLITVEMMAGYDDGAAPPELMAAAKLILGDLYTYRETVGGDASAIPTSATVEALLTNHRRFLL